MLSNTETGYFYLIANERRNNYITGLYHKSDTVKIMKVNTSFMFIDDLMNIIVAYVPTSNIDESVMELFNKKLKTNYKEHLNKRTFLLGDFNDKIGGT